MGREYSLPEQNMIGYFLRMSVLPQTFLNPYLESINEPSYVGKDCGHKQK